MRFITTAEWGANQSKDATPTSHPIGTTRGVTLHWTGNRMGINTHADCDDRVRGIERSHEYGNGWGDIAYNLLACPHGYVFEGRGAGVRSAANGDTGPNTSHYAVCYLGGQGDPFTEDGKQAMRDAVAYLRSHGAGPEVNGHRDHKATSCPGDEIYRWLNTTNFDNATTPEDDMGFTDWPQKDRDALAQAVAAEVARIPVNVIGEKDKTIAWKFAQARTLHAARTAAAAINADAIAAAVVAALPAGDISEATVAAGVKRALAELLEEK